MSHPFSIVDVFAEKKYAGNQLGVIRRAADLPGETMQRIARETNFAETTFVLTDQEEDGGFAVRIFTPTHELPFAGHPTLGTAWVIANEILQTPREEVVLNLKVGPIPVRFEPRGEEPPVLWMRQNQPTFGARPEPSAVAEAAGLELEDLDPRFPPEEVSTGIGAVIAPVVSLQALQRSRLRRKRYRELVGPLDGKLLLLFCTETLDPANDLHARVYAEHFGVPEDAATGSANGCLAAYLARHTYCGEGPVRQRVEQGHGIGRPSLLRLRAQLGDAGEVRVQVGGRVIPTVRGELL